MKKMNEKTPSDGIISMVDFDVTWVEQWNPESIDRVIKSGWNMIKDLLTNRDSVSEEVFKEQLDILLKWFFILSKQGSRNMIHMGVDNNPEIQEQHFQNITAQNLGIDIQWNTVHLDKVGDFESRHSNKIIEILYKLLEPNEAIEAMDVSIWLAYTQKKKLEYFFQHYGYDVTLTEINTQQEFQEFFKSDIWQQQMIYNGIVLRDDGNIYIDNAYRKAPILCNVWNYTLSYIIDHKDKFHNWEIEENSEWVINTQKFMRDFFIWLWYEIKEIQEISSGEWKTFETFSNLYDKLPWSLQLAQLWIEQEWNTITLDEGILLQEHPTHKRILNGSMFMLIIHLTHEFYKRNIDISPIIDAGRPESLSDKKREEAEDFIENMRANLAENWIELPAWEDKKIDYSKDYFPVSEKMQIPVLKIFFESIWCEVNIIPSDNSTVLH